MHYLSLVIYRVWLTIAMADESCAPLPPTGGHECDFADPVPDSLSCAVCLLPFRDPHLVSCCGKKYCAPCIGRVKAAGQPCPVCKQDFTSMLDRDYQRKVLNLNVLCSRKNNGCQWVGELRHLDHHEREECGWAVVECSYRCGAHLPRRLMAEHKRDACPQRPVDVKLEWFMKSMETKLTTERERHVREMAAVREEFRNRVSKITLVSSSGRERGTGFVSHCYGEPHPIDHERQVMQMSPSLVRLMRICNLKHA